MKTQAVSCFRCLAVWCGLLLALPGCHQHYEEGAHPPPIPPEATSPHSERPAAPAGGGKAQTEGAGTIHGAIRLAPDLADRIPPNAYLFVMARERSDGGHPYAVKRLPVPAFPFHYTLGQADVMPMMGTGKAFADIREMYLVARIDQDGQAGAPQPGDLEGACAVNPVAAGSAGCDIVIDRSH